MGRLSTSSISYRLPAVRYLMQSWAQSYWRDVAQARGDEGEPLRYTASGQFRARGLSAGDRLYVVGTADGELVLIGRMDVADVVPRLKASELLGDPNLFPAALYAIAAPPYGCLSFDRRVPEHIARAIRTVDGHLLKMEPDEYRLRPMSLNTVRFLTKDSAEAFDALIDA
jgi:hypothetical protein